MAGFSSSQQQQQDLHPDVLSFLICQLLSVHRDWTTDNQHKLGLPAEYAQSSPIAVPAMSADSAGMYMQNVIENTADLDFVDLIDVRWGCSARHSPLRTPKLKCSLSAVWMLPGCCLCRILMSKTLMSQFHAFSGSISSAMLIW